MVHVGISFIWKKKISPKHTLPNNKNSSNMDNFYVLTIAELLSLFPGSFCLNCGFYRHFCLGREIISPKHISGCLQPSQQQNTCQMDHFYALQNTDFVSYFLIVFGQLLRSPQVFLSFGGKMTPNTHIGSYLPCPMTETPGRWTFFMYFQQLNPVPYFLTVLDNSYVF